MSRRVLITGAGGYIGRYAVGKLIERGYEVHAADIRGVPESGGVRSHQANLLEPSDVDRLTCDVKATHLLHLAWYAEHGKFWTSPLNLDWVAASVHLFKRFAEQGGRRAAVAGTCAEYDWSHPFLSEQTTPVNPATLYGLCKDSLRQTLERFARENSLSLAWPRIFFLYGGDEHPDRFIPSIVKSLLAGQPAVVKCGSHRRDYLHVEDVASALVDVLDSPLEGAVNIASGESVTLGEIARQLGELTKSTSLVRIEHAPGDASNPAELSADVTRLKSIGFKPKYTLAAGLRTLISH